jgi:hypothetical protein
MIDPLRSRVMIPAILLACAVVTGMLWVALRIVTEGDAMTQRSATITVPGPPVHAHLLPAHLPAFTLLPVVRPAPAADPYPMRGPHLLPANPAG